jgi:hypothetical protein
MHVIAMCIEVNINGNGKRSAWIKYLLKLIKVALRQIYHKHKARAPTIPVSIFH